LNKSVADKETKIKELQIINKDFKDNYKHKDEFSSVERSIDISSEKK